jgi:hypothetical protein
VRAAVVSIGRTSHCRPRFDLLGTHEVHRAGVLIAARSRLVAIVGRDRDGMGASMNGPDRLLELCRVGRMRWTGQGWIAEPEEVVEALARDGFQECKREVARNPVDRRQAGGVWQGLNNETGAVASAVWVKSPEQSLVFIEIDGRPLAGG